MTAPRRKRCARALLALLLPAVIMAVMAATGCGSSYTIDGRVVRGGFGMVDFVPATAQQLTDPGTGIAAAQVSVYRDPTKPNQQLIATGRSDSSGRVSIPLDAFGAGWMAEQWRIEVYRPGFESIEGLLTLPGSGEGRRLLVVLRPGQATQPAGTDAFWDEYQKYK